MNQMIDVQMSIPVPADSIIIKKTEYQELVDSVNKGKWENLQWFKEKTGIYNLDNLKELILYPYKEVLDIENGGCVYYPEVQGKPYKFLKSKTENWLEENFDKVHCGK